jgi:PAS domain S-box-containing protein
MDFGEQDESVSATDAEPGVSLGEIPLHSTNLLTVLDESGIVRYESPSIERIFGYEQEELVGDPVAEYFHPDDREAVVDAFRTIVDSGEYTTEVVEYRHERADGTYCWVESVGSANPTPDGHYVINTRDISDRRAREQHLVRTNERLDEFARVLSHDLRNPLQVSQGHLELLRDECESDHIDAIERGHDRMETLIENLLTLAHDGTDSRDLEPVALASVAENCRQTVETEAVTLVVATDRQIRADESQLQQLLENLVRNAVTHGDAGGTIEIGTLADGFYVQDDGPGIPEAERERVFEMGYSSRDGATGIGLRIVSQVSNAHGWDITVTESPDGGTRFEFRSVESVEPG